MSSSTTSASVNKRKKSNIIPLRQADAAELEKISRQGLLSLSLDEMRAIQLYFNKLNRDPSDIELETLAQTWSEHCVHKTFKGEFTYQEEKLDGTKPLAEKGPKTYANLLKDTIAHVTDSLHHDWCLSVFKDNAGVISFDQEDGVSFKVETHNHPSALEPYGGAGTGIGGVIRDILGCGLGGKPILNTDVFCFGKLNTSQNELPDGALSPKRIATGVVSGVRDYGNRMGIPTANGTVYFDGGYVGNPLVFCGTVGIQPKNTIDKEVKPGDLVVVMGGRTGRDGIHGATFSSAPLESGITSNVVQIGHSIMEKKFMDVLLQARDKGLYRSITDCGAGGFSSAVGELGQDTGVRVDLEKAPLKYEGLAPWEIWVSESQERMVLAVAPDKWNGLRNLCQQEDVEAVTIGEFTDDKMLTLNYDGEKVGDLNMEFLHDGIPKLKLNALWNSGKFRDKHIEKKKGESNPPDYSKTLNWLLAHPNIASKEVIIRQYDHEVQGGMVIKPLMGEEYDAPTDACVTRPKLDLWRGVAISNGIHPEMGKWDPYVMATWAVDEAYRNIISVGGGIKNVAILDNFCWGDAKDALELGGLVRAAEGCRDTALEYKLPFISGKDSFNNTWKSADGTLKSIPPTLLISAIGVIEDVRNCMTSSLKRENNLLYLVGETSPGWAGSLVSTFFKTPDDRIPAFQPAQAHFLYKKMMAAQKNKNYISCHDLSEGGLAVTLAEMAFGGLKGVNVEIPSSIQDPYHFLFSESPGRFVVEVEPHKKVEFEESIGQRGLTALGTIAAKPEIVINWNGKNLLSESVPTLKNIWKNALKGL